MKIYNIKMSEFQKKLKEVQQRAEAKAQEVRDRYGPERGNLIVGLANVMHFWETVHPMLPPMMADAMTNQWSIVLAGAAATAATLMGIPDDELTNIMREMCKASVIDIESIAAGLDAPAKPTFPPERES